MADCIENIRHYKVGYVCGVFDLFHIGHLTLLKRCRKYCDHLIVGVDSDELTEVYKNKRPIISQEDRMAIIRELRCVDEVVLVDYHNESPLLAWSIYKFDVQFCGDDHEEALLETKNILREKGSDMVFFPYTTRTSTTKIRNELKNVKEEYKEEK